MAKTHKLSGLSLSVVSISRPGLFSDAFVVCCENCGQSIINTATVQDESGKQYTIGLDCKKTLIDAPKIKELLGGDFMEQYKAKEYKAQTGHIQKFLRLTETEGVTLECDGSEIYAHDDKPNKQFPEISGNTLYFENVRYLYKIGLKQLIHDLYRANKILGRVPA